MFYQGKYCCECGTRIERVEQNIFTSRKFCELCETDYKFEKLLKVAAIGILFVFGIVGISNVMFRPDENLVVTDNSKVETITENTGHSLKGHKLADKDADREKGLDSGQNEVSADKSAARQNLVPERNSTINKSVKVVQKSSAGAVYYCGAETKKGTPCSRKMKGGGRCWQHEGREAMLPEKDLLVKEQ